MRASRSTLLRNHQPLTSQNAIYLTIQCLLFCSSHPDPALHELVASIPKCYLLLPASQYHRPDHVHTQQPQQPGIERDDQHRCWSLAATAAQRARSLADHVLEHCTWPGVAPRRCRLRPSQQRRGGCASGGQPACTSRPHGQFLATRGVRCCGVALLVGPITTRAAAPLVRARACVCATGGCGARPGTRLLRLDYGRLTAQAREGGGAEVRICVTPAFQRTLRLVFEAEAGMEEPAFRAPTISALLSHSWLARQLDTASLGKLLSSNETPLKDA